MAKSIAGICFMLGMTLLGCKKESKVAPTDTATASFTINGVVQDSLVVGTYDQMLLTNTTPRLKTRDWNFGQGTVSGANDTVIAYSTPGSYTVMLNTEDSTKQTGHASTEERIVKALKDLAIIAITKQLLLIQLNSYEPKLAEDESVIPELIYIIKCD